MNRSKIAKKSRRKGQNFERTVCKLMKKLTGYEFKRTPQSGGWSKEKVTGDAVCISNDEFNWSIEIKNTEDWDLIQLLNPVNNKGITKIIHWWNQCRNDAKKLDKIPVLIFTKNYFPILMIVIKSDIIDEYKIPEYHFNYTYNGDKCIIFKFEEFIKINK